VSTLQSGCLRQRRDGYVVPCRLPSARRACAAAFDDMKKISFPVLLLALVLTAGPSWAEQIQFVPGAADDGSAATAQETPLLSAPNQKPYADFRASLQTAVESGELGKIRDLYQTNSLAPGDLKRELAHWRPLLAKGGSPTVFLYFKELSALPPTARRVWGDCARRLTTHKVTHLVSVRKGTAASMLLPLIAVDGTLLIVPSDKVEPGPGIEDGAANGSQSIRSEPNGTSGAARLHLRPCVSHRRSAGGAVRRTRTSTTRDKVSTKPARGAGFSKAP
jgi:hypothetical protein